MHMRYAARRRDPKYRKCWRGSNDPGEHVPAAGRRSLIAESWKIPSDRNKTDRVISSCIVIGGIAKHF